MRRQGRLCTAPTNQPALSLPLGKRASLDIASDISCSLGDFHHDDVASEMIASTRGTSWSERSDSVSFSRQPSMEPLLEQEQFRLSQSSTSQSWHGIDRWIEDAAAATAAVVQEEGGSLRHDALSRPDNTFTS